MKSAASGKLRPAEAHALGGERVFKREHGAPPLETDERGDAVEDFRNGEVFLGVLILPAPGSHGRRANAFLARVLRDVAAADVELIRGREVVERWIPLPGAGPACA